MGTQSTPLQASDLLPTLSVNIVSFVMGLPLDIATADTTEWLAASLNTYCSGLQYGIQYGSILQAEAKPPWQCLFWNHNYVQNILLFPY